MGTLQQISCDTHVTLNLHCTAIQNDTYKQIVYSRKY